MVKLVDVIKFRIGTYFTPLLNVPIYSQSNLFLIWINELINYRVEL
jgi:hypothetical protein